MEKRHILIILFLISSFCSSAYPISPRPLRKLVKESDFIIIGFVQEIVPVKEDNHWVNQAAKIKIHEVLKGTIESSHIEVGFNPNFICPAPPRYKKNTLVLAFLDTSGTRFYTHALSYGAKTLESRDVEIYKQRIQEIQEIFLLKDSNQVFIETVEWLVKCAEQESTRWEGVYELNPESDFMSYYSQDQAEPFKYLLSANQKERLKNALLSTREVAYTTFGLVDLVIFGNEEEVRGFLLSGLKSLSENNIRLADEIMARLLLLEPFEFGKKLLTRFQSIQYEYDYKKKKEQKQIIQDFIEAFEKIE